MKQIIDWNRVRNALVRDQVVLIRNQAVPVRDLVCLVRDIVGDSSLQARVTSCWRRLTPLFVDYGHKASNANNGWSNHLLF